MDLQCLCTRQLLKMLQEFCSMRLLSGITVCVNIISQSLVQAINYFLLLSEFIPYVFQVMSLLLEMHKNDIPSSYMALFPHLLQPVLWERSGNIPPLVRLLQAYLERGANAIASAAADKIVRINSNENNIFRFLCTGEGGRRITVTVHSLQL